VVECDIINEGVITLEGGEESIKMTLIRERTTRLEFTVPTATLKSGRSIVSPYGSGTVIFGTKPRASDLLQADLMAGHYGITGTHPDYPLEDWQDAVRQGETRSSYWHWVSQELKNAQQDFFELQ